MTGGKTIRTSSSGITSVKMVLDEISRRIALKKKWIINFLVMCATLLMVSPLSFAQDTQTDEKLNQLQKQLESLQQEMKDLKKQAEVRKKLEITQEEKAKKEKEILETAGNEYTLMKQNTLGVEYNMTYQYYSSDNVNLLALTAERNATHTLKNSLFFQYALKDNVTLNFNVPFVYTYDRTGTSNSKEVTDLGDPSFGFNYQPFKSGGSLPTTIVFGSFSLPMGRSPYEINPDTELATGNGYYSASAGISLSKTIDPIIAYGSLSYTYDVEVSDLDQKYSDGRILTKVEPGADIGLNIGIGYSLSYNASMTFSYQYVHRFENLYHYQNSATVSSGTSTSSILSIGTGWRFSPQYTVNLKVGIGLTDEDPDFIFTLRLPFEFDMN